jgi:F-type H+-transporting ATPase subunit delta
MQESVARRYADALIAIASERGQVEQLDHEAKALRPIFADAAVRSFFAAPQIPKERKRQLIDSQFGGKFDSALVNLMKVLVDKGRITYLPAILRQFDELTDRLSGVEEVTLVSATPLAPEQIRAIEEGLLRFSAYGSLRIKTQVDPDVLGGVLVKLGESQVIDGTVATRLQQLKTRMYRHRSRGLGA